MVKKKGYRPKGLIQILAAIGLVIAILWTAKGLFQVGGAGYKEIKNKVSSGSGLPVLKCVANDNTHTDIIDLQLLKDKNPTQDNLKKLSKLNNVSYEHIMVDDKEYFINYKRHENGYSKGYILKIDRNTGVAEYIFLKSLPITSTLAENIDAMMEAKRFFGVCEKVKRKKL